MATLTKAHKGMTLRHRETGDVFVIDSVFRNPANGYAGRTIAPFASVITDNRREFMPLSDLENDEFFEVVTG